MCGRYTLRQTDDVQQRFGIQQLMLALEPRYNIAPTQTVPVVIGADDERQLALMRWGLIPSWTKDPHSLPLMINARAEGIANKPAFRKPLRSQRCIVPTDGFYEWAKDGARKQPYFIHFDDDHLFGFAGLYDTYRDADGQETKTFTIITTTANDVLTPLHDRMPVILRREDEAEWLDPGVTDPFQIMRLLVPFPSDDIETYPVAPLVNRADRDTPALIKRQGDDSQQRALFPL